MHHQDRNVHTAGFRYSPETIATRRTFNAIPWLRRLAMLAAVLIAARIVAHAAGLLP
jgi:hypothetical protein